MKPRQDISDKIIHFTRGANEEEAFSRLRQIISEKRLIGGSDKIKGGYKCVCFTEAPLENLSHGLVNLNDFSRYSPFGILFEKTWIFGQGGRPVIYQPDDEFDLLPEVLRWRHMRYEPLGIEPVDFTWEREWRIHCDELRFTPDVACIVVPTSDWEDRLIAEHEEKQDQLQATHEMEQDIAEAEHEERQDFEVLQYSLIMDSLLAEQYRLTFSREEFYRENPAWRVCVLGQ